MYELTTLFGGVTADPTMRYTPGGIAVTNFTIATETRVSKEKECPQGWVEAYGGKHWRKTKYWRATAWRGLAEVVNQYVKTGSQVLVVGEAVGQVENGTERPKTWQTKDGETRADFAITVQTLRFGGKTYQAEESNAPEEVVVEGVDNIPW